MRASKLWEELERRGEEINRLQEDIRRLTAALVASEGKPAAAVALRPRKEPAEDKTPVPRPIGL